MSSDSSHKTPQNIWNRVREQLAENGIHINLDNVENFTEITRSNLKDLGNLKVDINTKNGFDVQVTHEPPDAEDTPAAEDQPQPQTSTEPQAATKAQAQGSEEARLHSLTVQLTTEDHEQLNAWIDLGLASSKEEAALLFMRDGFKNRLRRLEEIQGRFGGE